MQTRERGIARNIIAVAVIAIVVIAAAAGYALLSQGTTASNSTSTVSSSVTSLSRSNTSSTSSSVTTQSSSGIISTGSSTASTSSTTSSTSTSTTSSSSTSTQTTYQTSSSTSTNSCTTNSTIVEPPTFADLATLMGNFSQLSLSLSTSTTSHTISSYDVASASKGSGNITTYKVQINDNSSGKSSLTEAWITSAGTVLAVNTGGSNETGSQASSTLTSSADPFLTLILQGELLEVYTSSPQVGPANQTSATFGPTTLYVTNFASRTLPAVASWCQGSYTLTTFSLQASAVTGTNIILVTHEDVRGTEMTASGTTPVYTELQVLSITSA